MHPAVAQHGHPVGEPLDLPEEVGDVADRQALALQGAHGLLERTDLVGRQGGGGLVENEDHRVAAQRLGDLHQLALAHRQGADPVVDRAGRLEPLEKRARYRALPLAVDDAETALLLAEEDVVDDRERLDQAQVLEDDRDPGVDGLARGQRRVRPARHVDLTGVGRERAAERLDQRGLAGAVVPEQGVDLAGLDGEVHAAERVDPAEGLAQSGDSQCHGGLLRLSRTGR